MSKTQQHRDKHPPRIVKIGKMTLGQYRAIHSWVEYHYGKPAMCENCDGLLESTKFMWANISGEYKKDISDWARLCGRCHMFIDNSVLLTSRPWLARGLCKYGHKLSEVGTYTHHGYSRCVECRSDYRKRYIAKKKGILA